MVYCVKKLQIDSVMCGFNLNPQSFSIPNYVFRAIYEMLYAISVLEVHYVHCIFFIYTQVLCFPRLTPPFVQVTGTK
jgi:hypothetical protein